MSGERSVLPPFHPFQLGRVDVQQTLVFCWMHNLVRGTTKRSLCMPIGHFLPPMYQLFIGTIVLSCASVGKWGIPRVIPMKMVIMFLISGFLNMGNPQVTMGSICFNTKSWPSKVRRRRNHRLGAGPLGCSHPPGMIVG